MNVQENDIVMCTVKRTEGTTVFLQIKDNGEGTMIFSEVSPGRIRNIRDYVSINKKIVCKVLRVQSGHPELSLRRVTAKEREEVLEEDKKEKMLTNMLKPVFKNDTPEIIEKIKSSQDLSDFLDEARENPKLLKTISKGSQLEQLEKIFAEKKEAEKQVRTTIRIKSLSESGLADIKKVLEIKESEIYYKGSSKFEIIVKAKDYKTANNKLEEILNEIKSKAKKLNVLIETKEK